MKRWTLTVLSLVILFSLVLTSCAAPTQSATTAPTQPAAVAPTEKPAEKPTIIAILASGPASDLSWSQSLYESVDALKKEYGDRVDVRFTESVAWGEDTSKAMEQFIADGATIIVDGVSAGEFTTKVAQAHPEVYFIRTDSTGTGLPNEEALWYNGAQVSYLLGMAAGLVTKSNKLGYVNAFDMPMMRLEINAFELGAQSVNPNAVTSVVTINNWYDPATTLQASEALISSGVDVLWGVIADPADTVAIAEKNNAWAIGVMGNQQSFAPSMWLNGSVINFPAMLIDEIGRIFDGKWEGNNTLRFYGVPTGMTLNDWGPNVPQDVKDQVDAVLQKIINDGYDPLVGPIYDKDGNLVLAEGETFTGAEVREGVPWIVSGVEGLE